MTPEELEQGYAWIYQRLFSHASIWRRRPEDWQAIPLYLAMSYLYKRSNRFWHLLIKHDLVNPVWKPLGGDDPLAARAVTAGDLRSARWRSALSGAGRLGRSLT